MRLDTDPSQSARQYDDHGGDAERLLHRRTGAPRGAIMMVASSAGTPATNVAERPIMPELGPDNLITTAPATLLHTESSAY